MTRRRIAHAVCAAAFLGVFLAGLQGCGQRLSATLIPNQPPELEVLDARADRVVPTDVRVRWAARDPDGTVARCSWTLTPMRAGRTSTLVNSTTGNECLLPRAVAMATRASGTSRPEPDLLTLWAVDNRGAESERTTIAMFGTNIAPTVVITCPTPSNLIYTQTNPDVQITWTGYDPDGVFSHLPVKYRFKLLVQGNPEFDLNVARADPDSLRRYYAARAWAGWDSTLAAGTSATYTGLTPGASYLFVVTGFDEMGDYDPVFSRTKNMLDLQPSYLGFQGPKLSVWNTQFIYTQPSGGWWTYPSAVVNVEVPAGAPATFNVSAVPLSGQSMIGYRWMLDGDPYDQTPRSGPSDLRHWSDLGPSASPISPGSFTPVGHKRQEHMLYIEGWSGCTSTYAMAMKSLAMIHFVVVSPTYTHELLIVDDTRREVDNLPFPNGQVRPYAQPWPAAAELDTFLYARGGVPWRGTLVPASTVPQPVSSPGLFAGYSYDTIGTRGLFSGMVTSTSPFAPPNGAIPLSLLADYRHVIWITDQLAATNTGTLSDPIRPMSAIRYTSAPNRESVLGAYVAMGGKVWLLGGGAAYASLLDYDARGAANNNAKYGTGMVVFSGSPAANELVSGRLMYDMAHVRSEMVSMTVSAAATSVVRALGRFEGNPGAYTTLPAGFRAKSLALGDTLPPTRTSSAQFYSQTTRLAEFLTQPNYILEDASPDPNLPDPQSALDSLYKMQGGTLPATGYSPVSMLSYHGRDNSGFIWSGFDIWSFTSSDCKALVDGVLQGIWGMQRGPVPQAPLAATEPARNSEKPITVGANRALQAPLSRRR